MAFISGFQQDALRQGESYDLGLFLDCTDDNMVDTFLGNKQTISWIRRIKFHWGNWKL